MSVGDRPKRLPHVELECSALWVEIELKTLSRAGEILVELSAATGERLRRALPPGLDPMRAAFREHAHRLKPCFARGQKQRANGAGVQVEINH